MTPHTKKLARVDGGFIDVTVPTPQGVIVTMTGTAAASSYLGCTGVASADFELAQEFEITCSDPNVHTVALTLDSALVGFVRSKGHAGAAVRVAEVSVTPEGWDGTPLTLWYPPFGVTGKDGRLCNQHLPQIQDVPMPIGRYVISARFALDTQAKGVCDDHSVADFSPDTALPADWVRSRDPFQGVSKKSFGFMFALSASAPSASAPPRSQAGRPAASRSRRMLRATPEHRWTSRREGCRRANSGEGLRARRSSAVACIAGRDARPLMKSGDIPVGRASEPAGCSSTLKSRAGTPAPLMKSE